MERKNVDDLIRNVFIGVGTSFFSGKRPEASIFHGAVGLPSANIRVNEIGESAAVIVFEQKEFVKSA